MWAFLDYGFCSCICLGVYSCFLGNHVQISRAESDVLADVQNPKINKKSDLLAPFKYIAIRGQGALVANLHLCVRTDGIVC